MVEPLISIVIAVYNRQEYLADCVQSIRDQPYGPVEIVIVDDGSTKDLSGFADQCDVFVRSERNLGASYSRNVGVLRSRGEVLIFLDSDTRVRRDSLALLPALLEIHPDIGAIGGSGPPDAAGEDVAYILGKTYDASGRSAKIAYHPGDGAEALHDCDHLESAFLAMPRRVFVEIGGFDPYFHYMGEDRDLCLRIRDLGLRVVASMPTRTIHYGAATDKVARTVKGLDFTEFLQTRYLEVAVKRGGVEGGERWMASNAGRWEDNPRLETPLQGVLARADEVQARMSRDFLTEAALAEYRRRARV